MICKKVTIITNNSNVCGKYDKKYQINYTDGTLLDVLKITRDKIHDGYKLLSHPLSGSVKPNETVYKSVIVSNEKGNLDIESLMFIESAIETAEKFINMKQPPSWNNEILSDFREIDCTLIDSAIESMETYSKI
ncbi:GrdX family protein [Alkaliphilus transvaalensis]|uniref:GrdX family protein n=1 Tax=Alkaliphilus transvaalensis TaxID=114628 RepID=UPI000554ABCF|nr:GrdX family protein [Alkaliphilus transvaalensis]